MTLARPADEHEGIRAVRLLMNVQFLPGRAGRPRFVRVAFDGRKQRGNFTVEDGFNRVDQAVAFRRERNAQRLAIHHCRLEHDRFVSHSR